MAYRLLVIAGTNEALRALPEQLGDDVEVTLMESVNDALWELRSNPPEAIIADVDLPDMSGLDMAEIIPSFDVPTRVLLYSREYNPSAQKQAEERGVYSFLQGGTSISDMHTTLRAAMVAARDTPPPQPHNGSDAASIVPDRQPDVVVAHPTKPEPEPPVPVRKRTPPAPPPRKSSGSLRSAVQRSQSTPVAEPAPAPQPHPQRRRAGGTLVVTTDNLTPIQTIMGRLSQDLGTQCIMLTDRAGMVLVEVGSTHTLPTMILLPLLSTSFSTTGEVARQLGEEDATTLYIHEGINYDLYCFDIAQRFLLVLVFNKKVASSKIGTVWISTKRAIRELQEVLS